MTGPVTTEALVEGLATFLAARFPILKWQAVASAEAAIAGPLAPFLAVLQQVTAERDEARAKIERLSFADETGAVWRPVPGWTYFGVCRQISTAKAELARLRAEGEAKDRRIAVLTEALAPFAKAGELFGPRLSDSYDQSIYAPAAGSEFAISADHLRAARAATARDGA